MSEPRTESVEEELERLRWLESRVNEVLAAIEGKSYVNAELIRRLL